MSVENSRLKYYLYINGYGVPDEIGNIYNLIDVHLIDIQQEKIIQTETYSFLMPHPEYKDFQQHFIHSPPPKYVLDGNVKGVVITLYEMVFRFHSVIIKTCQQLREVFGKLDIPSRFMKLPELYSVCCLTGVEYKGKVGKPVVIVLCSPEDIQIIEMERKYGKYQITRKSCVKSVMSSANLKKTILGPLNPGKVIIGSITKNFKVDMIKKAFNTEEFLVVKDFLNSYIPRATKAIIDVICEINTRFHIQPICGHSFVISKDENIIEDKIIQFSTHPMDPLPFVKELELLNDNYFLLVKHPYPRDVFYATIEKVNREPSSTTKTIKLMLMVNNNGIPSLRNSQTISNFNDILFKPFIDKINKNFPVLLINKNDEKIITATWNEKRDGLDAICPWDDCPLRDEYIAFDEKKPKFFSDAFEVYNIKPSFVVYDIIKIMSMSPDNIEIDPAWKFKIGKSKKHPILIEFNYFDGTRKASTPVFLFALLLKQHLKVIRRHIEKKPSEISIFFDALDAATFERIQTEIKKSCQMLNVSCHCVKL